MAVSTADLIAWRDALIQSRLSGVLRVRDALRTEVEYRSDAEMERAIASANEMIAAATVSQPVTTLRFHTSKGLGHWDQRRFGWY
jgi:hypothetical protein